MHDRRRIHSILTLFFFLVGGAISAAPSPKPIESFTAFAVALGSGKAGVIKIDIFRWSTDEEREMLLNTLVESGQNKLLDALEKIRPPVGSIRTPNSLAYDLYYARNNPQPDGSRRIVLATNRRVAFREAANNTRSMQYQFNLIEIHMDKDGKGEGKMVPAAKVSWDKEAKKIEIENYNALPVDLTTVTVDKPKE